MGTKPVPMAPNFHVDITGLKSQASSSKLQAPRHKRQAQAASSKLTDHGPFIKFQAPRTELSASINVLYGCLICHAT